MSRADTNPAGMAPLQRLILDRMRKRGWEPKEVEARGVKHATLHRYMNPVQLLQLPRRSVLEDLARGLQLPVEEVTQAAKDSVGWDSTKDLAWRNSRPDVEVDRSSVGGDRDGGSPVATGGGGRRALSEFSLAELADEIRRRADEGS